MRGKGRETLRDGPHRFFKWQMTPDSVIALSLMAWHRGASNRGNIWLVREVLRAKTNVSSVINWRRKFCEACCLICRRSRLMGRIRLCDARGCVTKSPGGRCKAFSPTLLGDEEHDKAESTLRTRKEWRPWLDLGRPGPRRTKGWDTREYKRLQGRRYYRDKPDQALRVVKNPDRLYHRLKLRSLTPEEKKARKRQQRRNWVRLHKSSAAIDHPQRLMGGDAYPPTGPGGVAEVPVEFRLEVRVGERFIPVPGVTVVAPWYSEREAKILARKTPEVMEACRKAAGRGEFALVPVFKRFIREELGCTDPSPRTPTGSASPQPSGTRG